MDRIASMKTAALAFALTATAGLFSTTTAFADGGTGNGAAAPTAPQQPAATQPAQPAETKPEPKPQPNGPMVAKMGTPYLMSGCEVILEKAEYTTMSLPNLFGPVRPDDGTHYMLFTIHIANHGVTPVLWTYDSFRPTLQTSANAKILRGGGLLTSNNKRFELQPLQPGEEKTLHFHYQVPMDVNVSALTIGETAASPKYSFDLTAIR